MNEMKLLKFATMIEDLDRRISSYPKNKGMNIALGLIFDYNKCNEYAKKIIENSNLFIRRSNNFMPENIWEEQYSDIKLFSDMKTKIEASKSFIQQCRAENNTDEGYKFIFWALMILAVDKYNADEYLSTVCDFAKMLKINSDEFKVIINVIECIYNRSGNLFYICYNINNDTLKLKTYSIFRNLFDERDEYKL